VCFRSCPTITVVVAAVFSFGCATLHPDAGKVATRVGPHPEGNTNVPEGQSQKRVSATSPAQTSPSSGQVEALVDRVHKLQDRSDRADQQLAELQQQLAAVKDRLERLDQEMTSLQEVVVERYEEFLQEDRAVLEQVDALLALWLEQMGAQQTPSLEQADASRRDASQSAGHPSRELPVGKP
jgi:TolA-binding protein